MSPRVRQTSERRYEGGPNDVGVSLIMVDTAPADGPELHVHPYEEVFVVQVGNARFTVGDDTLEAGPGDVLVAPADTPHRFVNIGADRLRMVAIHVSPKFIQEWVE
jgi:mannose-6-phosphate isomerase-like protein (cupin superfamily)